MGFFSQTKSVKLHAFAGSKTFVNIFFLENDFVTLQFHVIIAC